MFNDTTVIEENLINFNCEALGYPPPSIMWNRIEGNLSDRVSVSERVSVPTGNGNVTRVSVNLTITNAYREDTGVYTCSANNSIGSDSRNFNITIQCKLLCNVYVVIDAFIILTNLCFQLLQKFFSN